VVEIRAQPETGKHEISIAISPLKHPPRDERAKDNVSMARVAYTFSSPPTANFRSLRKDVSELGVVLVFITHLRRYCVCIVALKTSNNMRCRCRVQLGYVRTAV